MSTSQQAVLTWRKRMATATLPMLSVPEVVEELLSADVDLERVAQLLDHDPPLALDIVLAAGRLPNGPGTVQSLQHALNLMGIQRVQNFIRARSSRPFDPQSHAHRAFLQAVAVGRFAASLVTRWEEKRAPGTSAYLACVALLLGLSRWKLPLADPKLARELEKRVATGERRSVVENELLGCTMGELNGAVLVDAGFPPDSPLLKSFIPDNAMLLEAARCAWTEQLAPEVPAAVGRWLRQTTMPALLAHLLAWAAQDGWYENRTLLYLKVVSARENKPLDRIITDVHRTAVFATRSLGHVAGLVLSPAEQLIFPHRDPRHLLEKTIMPAPAEKPAVAPRAPKKPAPEVLATPPRRVEPKPASDRPDAAAPLRRNEGRPASTPALGATGAPARTTAAAAAAATAPASTPVNASVGPKLDITQVQRFVLSCREHRFADLRQLMQQTGDALDKGLSLRRSLVLLHPANTTRLGCYMRHGFSGELANATLELRADETNLITRLIQQGGSILVPRERVAGAQAQLPECLRRFALSSGFALTAVRMNERPIGVMWADTGDKATAVHSRQYEGMRVVSTNFSSAFSELAKTLRKK